MKRKIRADFEVPLLQCLRVGGLFDETLVVLWDPN